MRKLLSCILAIASKAVTDEVMTDANDDADSVEEGGDSVVDQEVLAATVLDEPELLSCISEDNCARIVAAASEAVLAAVISKEGDENVLCMISEEDEERSPSMSGSTPEDLTTLEHRTVPLANQLVLARTGSSTIFKARAEVTSLV